MNNNNQNSKSYFFTKLRQKKDRNGNTYYIGNMGALTLFGRPHKTNADELNLFVAEQRQQQGGQQKGFGANQQQSGFQQSGGGYAGPEPEFSTDEIPF